MVILSSRIGAFVNNSSPTPLRATTAAGTAALVPSATAPAQDNPKPNTVATTRVHVSAPAAPQRFVVRA
jgi:hypothetical protein